MERKVKEIYFGNWRIAIRENSPFIEISPIRERSAIVFNSLYGESLKAIPVSADSPILIKPTVLVELRPGARFRSGCGIRKEDVRHAYFVIEEIKTPHGHWRGAFTFSRANNRKLQEVFNILQGAFLGVDFEQGTAASAVKEFILENYMKISQE